LSELKFSGINLKQLLLIPNGNSSGGEIIDIQTKEDFYQCTRLSSKVIKGIKNGECFREVDVFMLP
jgi:hypothetical protein